MCTICFIVLQLQQDNKINKFVLTTDIDEEETGNSESNETVDKRSRHLRLCLRRNGSSYIPYPCWRRGKS